MGNMPVVEVGVRKVRVKRLLSEGGYARVYKVREDLCSVRDSMSMGLIIVSGLPL